MTDRQAIVARTTQTMRTGKHEVNGLCGQAASRLRPLRRRPAMIARPARVRIRRRKPCVLLRRRLFGWNVRLVTDNISHTHGRYRDDSRENRLPQARHMSTNRLRSRMRHDNGAGSWQFRQHTLRCARRRGQTDGVSSAGQLRSATSRQPQEPVGLTTVEPDGSGQAAKRAKGRSPARRKSTRRQDSPQGKLFLPDLWRTA